MTLNIDDNVFQLELKTKEALEMLSKVQSPGDKITLRQCKTMQCYCKNIDKIVADVAQNEGDDDSDCDHDSY